MDENIEDPRGVLAKCLQELGLTQKDSITISLDAGSSQVPVDKNYLENEFNFSKSIRTKVLKIVRDFYAGCINDI